MQKLFANSHMKLKTHQQGVSSGKFSNAPINFGKLEMKKKNASGANDSRISR